VTAEVQPDYADQPLGRFLELVASPQPAPGGGSAAAIGVALAAGLVAMAARFSEDQIDEAAVLAVRAHGMQRQATALAQADAAAYQRVVDAGRGGRVGAGRRQRIRAALSAAADVPCEIVRLGATVAELAAQLAERGNPNLRGDAVSGALLAEAGVRAAAELVAINLTTAAIEDGRPRECTDLVETASNAARRALAASHRGQVSENA
jgi:formiminotetrahydrofolate cyclodeaminase